MGGLRFIVVSLSLASGFFSLGGLSFIYLRYRTSASRIAATFALSLVLLALSQWADRFPSPPEAGRAAFSALIALAGIALNIAIVPPMAAAMVSESIRGRLRLALYAWDAAALAAACLYPILRSPALAVLHAQLLATIAASVAFLAIRVGSVKRRDQRASLRAFIASSAAFLAALAVDMSIGRLGLSALEPFDGLSLPLYIIALNVGLFAYAWAYLGSEPLSKAGRLTDACKARFGITRRESDIIEALLGGRTNQEIADALFISRKTVENHLHNVFQKMGVANRVQLIGTLGLWRDETRG